jgi:predicted RNase H-like nuclease (RuvC/YqgF family)
LEIQREADNARIDQLEKTVAELMEDQQSLRELVTESRRRLDAYARYCSNLYDDVWDMKDMAMRLEDDDMSSNIFRLTQQRQMESDD